MTNYLYPPSPLPKLVATTSLKAVAGFSKPLPLLLVVAATCSPQHAPRAGHAHPSRSACLRHLVRARCIVLVSLAAMFVYGQCLTPPPSFPASA